MTGQSQRVRNLILKSCFGGNGMKTIRCPLNCQRQKPEIFARAISPKGEEACRTPSARQKPQDIHHMEQIGASGRPPTLLSGLFHPVQWYAPKWFLTSVSPKGYKTESPGKPRSRKSFFTRHETSNSDDAEAR